MTAKTTRKRTAKPKVIKVAKLPELPLKPFAFEVFDLASNQRSKVKKIEVLKKYEDLSLKQLFKWNFDSTIVSVLPDGEVPYSGYDDQTTYSGTLTTRINEEVRRMHEVGSFSLGASDKEGHTTIRREAKHFYRFVRGGDDAMNAIRRETMFINILEGLHPLEAEIVVLVKDGRLEDKYSISKEVVSEAYPDIIWGDA
tara:strand:+ start:33 stop:626 length:594 start_codon:yes stop_codon:yes gene_type:complete